MSLIFPPVRRHSGGIYLALALLALYLLSTGGDLFISDGEVILKTTAALAFEGRIALVPDPGLPQIVPGRDGRFFSKYGLGQPLAAVPFFRAGLVFARLGADAAAGDKIMRLTLIGFNALAGAASALALYLAARQLADERAALMVAALYGLATPAWPYAKIFFSEPLLTLCLLVALFAALRASASAGEEGGQRALAWALLCGLAAGYAALTKPLAGVALPAFALYLGFAALRRGRHAPASRRSRFGAFGVQLSAFAAGAAPLVALTLFHNYHRFGSIADNGYGAERFSTPFFIGLYGLLFSGGRGALWYAPPLVLGLVALPTLWRQSRALTLLVAALALPPLLISASWWAWHGGWGWGPRLIAPYIPLVLLAAAPLLGQGRGWALAWATLLLGILVQLPGVVVNFNQYMAQVIASPVGRQLAAPAAAQVPGTLEATLPYLLPEDLAYHIAEYSPILGQWRMLLRGEGFFVTGFDLAARGLPPPVATALTLSWLVMLLLAAALLSRRLITFKPPTQHASQPRGEREALP
jgi:4-amino-4-deoxy-L-arabinose transferase-like glycosyltransferase